MGVFCVNLNHRRSNAPVRYCPLCGEVVNGLISTRTCAEDDHAKKRREMNKYCVNCGDQLIKNDWPQPGRSSG